MSTETTALAIASSADNVGMIIRDTPETYRKNNLSHDNCLRACEALLARIKTEGMTDELDQTAARIIEKTRRTIKAMNESRSPVTKLFDVVRKEFTALENDIDPTKAGTAPYRIQQVRNRYAAKKHEEEEARRRAEEAKRQAELARAQYRDALSEDYKAQFNNLVVARLNELTELNAKVTLDSYQAVLDTITGYAVELPADWRPASQVPRPLRLAPDESRTISNEVLVSLRDRFVEQYRAEIGDYRREILDRLPSKRVELERAAKASADEAARIKADMARREAEEAARKEAERVAREQQQAKQAEALKAGTEAANLFDIAKAATPEYQPKVKIARKINIIEPQGYMQVVSMWWAREGCRLSKDELDKIFKKQISFCERLANKDGEFIKDSAIEYVDDIKAQ